MNRESICGEENGPVPRLVRGSSAHEKHSGCSRLRRDSTGLRCFRIIPLIWLLIWKPTAPFPPAPLSAGSALSVPAESPQLWRQDARQEQPLTPSGFWEIFVYPNVPEGLAALGLSTTPGQSCSRDMTGYNPDPAPLPRVIGSDNAQPCCGLNSDKSDKTTFPFPYAAEHKTCLLK